MTGSVVVDWYSIGQGGALAHIRLTVHSTYCTFVGATSQTLASVCQLVTTNQQ